jgi:hypothetical protein
MKSSFLLVTPSRLHLVPLFRTTSLEETTRLSLWPQRSGASWSREGHSSVQRTHSQRRGHLHMSFPAARLLYRPMRTNPQYRGIWINSTTDLPRHQSLTCNRNREVKKAHLILWHEEPLLGGDRETDDCTAAVARQRPANKNGNGIFCAVR